MRPVRGISYLPCLLAALFLGLCAVPTSAQQSPKIPAKCGVFFDKWDVKGLPPSTLLTLGFAHEVMAAKDCIKSQNLPMACEHYRKLMKALEKADPAVASEHSADVKTLMQKLKC